jgi:osmotically inducible protein OsmC
MPATPLSKILYTAEAVVEGGRAGHGRSSDGRLDLQLSVPEDMGGQGGPGTNPEQLFALGYAACFQSALLAVAQGRHLDASDSQITARVGIGPTHRRSRHAPARSWVWGWKCWWWRSPRR